MASGRIFHSTSSIIALLKRFGRVVLVYFNGPLAYDRPQIGLSRGKVGRRAGQLDAVIERRLMYTQAVQALTTEGRDE